MEEGLKETYSDGGKWLWVVMVKEYPNQFSESVQTQTKHAEPLLMDSQLSRIRKWNGLGRMHQSLKRHGKSILSLFPEDL